MVIWLLVILFIVFHCYTDDTPEEISKLSYLTEYVIQIRLGYDLSDKNKGDSHSKRLLIFVFYIRCVFYGFQFFLYTVFSSSLLSFPFTLYEWVR